MSRGLKGRLEAWWAFEEAPLEWLVGSGASFAPMLITFGLYLSVLWYYLEYNGSVLLWLSLAVACCGFALRNKRVSPFTDQVIYALIVCVTVAGTYYAIGFTPSPVFVYRSTGIVGCLWRMVMPFAARQLKACVVCSTVCTLVECVILGCSWAALGLFLVFLWATPL